MTIPNLSSVDKRVIKTLAENARDFNRDPGGVCTIISGSYNPGYMAECVGVIHSLPYEYKNDTKIILHSNLATNYHCLSAKNLCGVLGAACSSYDLVFDSSKTALHKFSNRDRVKDFIKTFVTVRGIMLLSPLINTITKEPIIDAIAAIKTDSLLEQEIMSTLVEYLGKFQNQLDSKRSTIMFNKEFTVTDFLLATVS